ncbi:MAG: acetylxylan esterase [Sphingobacteriaceae bacterium]
MLLLLTRVAIGQLPKTNYIESEVPVYTLPKLLVTTGNLPVFDKTEWEKIRRPEIRKLFEDNIYGKMPSGYDRIAFRTMREDPAAMNGKAQLKEVRITVYRNKKAVTINVVVILPNHAKRRVPVFLLINNRNRENTDPTRIIKSAFWPAELVIDSGYAIAAFQIDDLAPDDQISFKNGVLQLYPDQLDMANGMRAIGAWAWGASRVMDYFEQLKTIDAKIIVLVGHSRGGKAALWAAAQDERFAICVSNCSGNTGAALARRQFGERIADINTSFPHWFNNQYKKYNGRENDLPVDQHMLIALMAPRPVYVTNASLDLWADPVGTFLALKQAEPVYQLYDLTSQLPSQPPAINSSIINNRLGYHNREGKHDLTKYDWTNFIRFANHHFKPTQ